MIQLTKRKTKKTITQTIRFDGDLYDNIMDIAKYNDISFNSVVNQLLIMILEIMKERM